ncbi:hypothetical protein ABT033_31155 [Streptomyces pharetrae]|uniref:hypothetical protein n=1 Tax=Streptomyces pharetrae TaxID=291370 RepID=UPI003363EAD2
MLLEKGRAAYYQSSDTASQQTRQLGIAGIAIVWLLSGGLQTSGINLNDTLLKAAICLILALTLDILQYVWKTATFAIWVRLKESEKRLELSERNVDDQEVGDAPSVFLWGVWAFFYLKIMALILGYWWIFSEMFSRINLS